MARLLLTKASIAGWAVQRLAPRYKDLSADEVRQVLENFRSFCQEQESGSPGDCRSSGDSEATSKLRLPVEDLPEFAETCESFPALDAELLTEESVTRILNRWSEERTGSRNTLKLHSPGGAANRGRAASPLSSLHHSFRGGESMASMLAFQHVASA